ncbi:MAG: CHASE2 domain-containing protein [Gammaproteobacteria bacterium]
MKNGFWKTDGFAALVISIFFLVAWYSGSSLLAGLERDVYDLGVRITNRDSAEKAPVAVIAIDDQSITNIGRWPWSREIHGDMIEKLTKAGAKVIGYTVFFTEPQLDPGLKWIRELREDYSHGGEDPAFAEKLAKADFELDGDARLSTSIERAKNVVLPMLFMIGEPVGKPDAPLPDYVTRFAREVSDDTPRIPTDRALPPIPPLGTPAKAIGHLTAVPDPADGAIREEALLIGHYNMAYPSEALMIAASYLNLGVEDIKINDGDSVELGKLLIKTDPLLRMKTFFYQGEGDKKVFTVDSFYDVKEDKIPASNYKDKIVLIGPTAFGLGDQFVTPLGEQAAPVLIMAHTVASILNQHFFVAPSWAGLVEFLIFISAAAYLIAVLPRLKAGVAAAVSAGLVIFLLLLELVLMKSQLLWLQTATTASLLFIGHLLITTKRFLATEVGKRRADIESAMGNRDVGLAFQQQGQLDMAFERFRRVPLDDSMMDTLMSLASDFERKRQFNKASQVYQYMATHNPKYRDLDEKMKRAKMAEETVIFGGPGRATAGGTMILNADGQLEKPMLGRYQVEKELGKGAMGVVYLGRDPKINRVVAIKTMALSQEFEADELASVKERFFREAETAGRLNHPNCVAIYDVGEEHDLCYIAMEFLEGHDLTAHVKQDNLLPLPLVMGIIYKAALALDYAHKQNVVHRDIKPANIMFDPKTKNVKLTDFGIARITDSSKTKTGMVLGTPSYMSPEQLSGKHVDGRSDLFSLGVTLYQMVTGRLPFSGDSMATLMYKIANERHPELNSVKPELAKTKPCLAAIIDKALEKDVTKRYQSGAELARDLQNCARQPATAA